MGDARIFQECGLATKFDEEDDQLVSPRRGLADKGYHALDPTSKLTQCLLVPFKKKHNAGLTPREQRINQLIATVRVEVERAIGRLRNLHRLVVAFRSSDSSLDSKKAKHAKTFKIAIHFTNYSLTLRPLRKEPHWLLGMSDLPVDEMRKIVRAFLDGPPGLHVHQLLELHGYGRLEPICDRIDDENDDEEDENEY